MPSGVSFDLSINITSIISVVAALITFVTSFNKLSSKIDVNAIKVDGKFKIIEQRMDSVEGTLKDIRTTNERLAVIETRQATHGQLIANVQTEVVELRHGRGFVQRRSDGGIDGEYK